MSKDPAFLFYSSDFILGTLFMSFEDRGKFITILSCMHQRGRISEAEIKKLAEDISAELKSKFKIDENGLWYNERLEEEIARRKRFVFRCRENGKMGGRKPTRKSVLKKPVAPFTDKDEESFNRFWQMYGKPTEKQACKLKWKNLAENERELIFQKLPAYVEATPERQFRKNPLTYLNRKIWLDEFVPELPKALKKSAIELLAETGRYE